MRQAELSLKDISEHQMFLSALEVTLTLLLSALEVTLALLLSALEADLVQH